LVEPQVERSHNRKHIARIRHVLLRNREIIRRTGKTGRSTLGAGCDPAAPVWTKLARGGGLSPDNGNAIARKWNGFCC
jgi:hypothetical protein